MRVTCEFNPNPCDNCEITHCPDQVEEIFMTYQYKKEAVENARHELDEATEDLENYYEDYREILGP